jgi:copper transport protein
VAGAEGGHVDHVSAIRRSLAPPSGLLGALAALVLALGLVAASPGAVLGHSLLQSATPAPGSTLASPPTSIKLTFGEAPDPRLSSIRVLDKGGASVTSAVAAAVPGDAKSLEVAVGPLPDGVYTVAWRTVSAVDGHVAAGSFAFGVGETPPPVSATTAPPAATGGSPAAILARFLLYAGLIALLGAGYVAAFVHRAGEVRIDVLVRLATAAWLVAAIGTAFTVAVQWEEAGGDLAAILGSSIGLAGLARIAAIVLVAVPIAFVARVAEGARRRWLGLAAVGAVIAMTVDVAVGHAASDQSGLIGLAAQWAHVVAVGLWIGGLLALLLAVRGEPTPDKANAVRRFSTWAAPWIALVALTGVVRAVQEVGTVDALLGQAYGQLIVAKSVLLVLLAVLGATNRWWSVPAAGRSLVRLRRIGTTEIGVATVVIALAAALVNGVPPVSIGATAQAGPAPIVAIGADAGTSVKLRLAISPGAAGLNTFDAVATDYDSGQPFSATVISLRFSLLSRTGVGGSTLDLQPSSETSGMFRGTGTNLSVDGIWRITATVTEAGVSVEVPFVIATTLPSQPVDVLPGTGTPTIYTVHLPDGTTAQIYLDPGTAGHDELHATFFDAAGTERSIMTASMATTAGAGELLGPRLLEPGHFVSEIDVEAGSLPVDVVGLDAAGQQVHVHATIEVQP